MKNNKIFIIAILAALSILASCNKDEKIADAPLRIYLQLPMNLENANLVNAKVTLVNIETMARYCIENFEQDGNNYVATAVVHEGRYNITATGNISYSIGTSATTTKMKAESMGVEVTNSGSASSMVTLLFNNYNAEAGMVIEEIFFTSSTFSGTQRPYTDDQYLILTNNSDHLIYADSLAIVESKFQSDMQWELTPNLMKDAITVSWLYLIPGNGTSVPVEAGESLLIALNAKNSFDALLVFGCTVMLSLQSFIIIAGVVKLIPLTGITLPFLSYGGSSMIASFIELGIIEGVAIKNGESDESDIREMGGEVE